MVLGSRLPGNNPRPASLDLRLTDAVDRARRSLQPRHQLASVSADKAVLVVADTSVSELDTYAHTLFASAILGLADLDGAEPIMGVSEPATTFRELARAHKQAELALSLGSAVPMLSPLREVDQLGPMGLLGLLLANPDPAAFRPLAIRRLSGDEDEDEDEDEEMLLATLEAYLEHARDVAATAAALFLHRSSLYKRLHRIERLADVDLHSGNDRLQLHVGLILRRIGDSSEGRRT
jgi:sugar diacid utilization regulator